MTTLTAPIRPKRTRGKPTEDGEFVVFEHVPVFDEHVGDDGTVYDEQLLRRIADNCNRRIRTTGDWCPAVVAHTRDREEKSHVNDDPPVIALAGPFYVADFVNHEGKTVKAIYTTFWVFPDQEQTFLRNPRRSVEIWPEERPEDRFFDPIALLGSETPKRDLGMVYSRARTNCQPLRHCLNGPMRYSKRSTGKLRYQEVASTPGGNNTFIPGPVQKKKTGPEKHSKGSTMALSPDDLNQILEALKPTIQSMIDAATPAIPDAADDLGDDGLGDPTGAPPDLDGLDAGGAGAPPPPVGAPPPPVGGPPAPPDAGGPPDDIDEQYSRGLGRKFMKYKKDDGFGDDADSFMGSLDDEDKSHLDAYMKYMCDDEDTKQKYSERYAKSPIGGTDISDNSGSMCRDEMKAGEPDRYHKGTRMATNQQPQQYAKIRQERDEAVKRYAKLKGEHDDLKQKYAKMEKERNELRTKERYSRRFAQLKNLEVEYAFDVEEEMSLTEDFSDQQFERHVSQVIPGRYSRVSGSLLATEREQQLKVNGDDEPQKYAKQATDLVQRYRKQGRHVEYKRVLDHLVETHGKPDEAKLFTHEGNGHAA